MKIRIPRQIVEIWAPTFDFMCFFAHSPKAWEPPARFMRATMVPRITRKIMIPTFQLLESCFMKPFSKVWVRKPEKDAPEKKECTDYDSDKKRRINFFCNEGQHNGYDSRNQRPECSGSKHQLPPSCEDSSVTS